MLCQKDRAGCQGHTWPGSSRGSMRSRQTHGDGKRGSVRVTPRFGSAWNQFQKLLELPRTAARCKMAGFTQPPRRRPGSSGHHLVFTGLSGRLPAHSRRGWLRSRALKCQLEHWVKS